MTVYAWGDDEYGQLGLGHTGRAQLVPLEVPAFAGADEVVAGAGHTMIRRGSGLFGVGANRYGGLCCGDKAFPKLAPVRALLPPVTSFALVESHGLAITANGARTWGGNMLGQIGNGQWSEGEERLEPPGCYDTAQVPENLPALRAVGGGQYHNLCIDTSGRLWAWGANDKGQLGLGARGVRLVPARLSSILAKVVAADGGNKHSGALCVDGSVRLWGSNGAGQLGLPLTTAFALHPVVSRSNIKQISLGGTFTLLLDGAGRVFMAGEFLSSDEPEEGWGEVAFPEPVRAVSGGVTHALAIGESGKVYGWGHNRFGQVGDGTQSLPGCANEDKPTPVDLGITATAISAGWLHSLAIA